MKRSRPGLVTLCGSIFVVLIAAKTIVWGNGDGTAYAPPVIYDHDADFDDTVALAALAEQHLTGRIDLRVVTITNNGAGLPGKGYLHVRCLLDALGLDHIPVADATYDLPHVFPDTLRFASERRQEEPKCLVVAT